MTIRAVFAAALALVVLWGAPHAAAQSVDAALDDLRDFDVTFETGALSDAELAELDETVGRLEDADGFLKVVVLAEPVSDHPSARAFAQAVRDGVGGSGRVIVFAVDEVGIASDVDDETEIGEAEEAAAAATSSFAAGVEAAVAALTARAAGTDGAGTSGDGFPWTLVIVVAVIVALAAVGLLAWRRSRRASRDVLDEAEDKVRAVIDHAAALVLELDGRTVIHAEADAAYHRGAELYTSVFEQLEEADTRDELEAVWPSVVESAWQLDVANALLSGQPVPARPDAGLLFPPVPVPEARPEQVPAGTTTGTSTGTGGASNGGAVPPTPPVVLPAPHYRQRRHSPWITRGAAAAIAVAAGRIGRPVPRVRPPLPRTTGTRTIGTRSSRVRSVTRSPVTRSRGLPPRATSRGRGEARGMGRRR